MHLAAGESYRAIAPDFGASYGAIYRIVRAARKRAAGGGGSGGGVEGGGR